MGEVGPGVDGLLVRGGLALLVLVRASRAAVDGGCSRRLGGRIVLGAVHAAGGIVHLGAVGGPLRHQEQVGGQAPRGVRFEHVVLEDEVLGVGPVVGYVTLRVVPHDVRCGRAGACRVGRV